MAMIYIVAYDISSNRRRTRVAKALQSWGYRIQESVFQLRLDAAGLNAMRARLAALINEAEDVVHIYPLCSTCAERAEILGAAVALDDVGLCRGVVRNQLSLISSGLSHPSSRLSNRGARPRPDFGFPLFESV